MNKKQEKLPLMSCICQNFTKFSNFIFLCYFKRMVLRKQFNQSIFIMDKKLPLENLSWMTFKSMTIFFGKYYKLDLVVSVDNRPSTY